MTVFSGGMLLTDTALLVSCLFLTQCFDVPLFSIRGRAKLRSVMNKGWIYSHNLSTSCLKITGTHTFHFLY